jgi:hypothetical protein
MVACREKKIERKNKLKYLANRASAASVLCLLLLQAPVSRNTLPFKVVRRRCLVIFSPRRRGAASSLPGDDDVPATEVLQESRKYEEYALSRGMELVYVI